ncbi:MAG TPA: hypothetical protein VJA26_04575 [Gammaproteobacteria bacterium]|nr:hypothetical protein [Gammaproteobacteria bacterium]
MPSTPSPERIGREHAHEQAAVARARLCFASFNIGGEWAINPTLYMNFGAERFSQRFTNESDTKSSSNSLYIGVTFRGRSRQNQ